MVSAVSIVLIGPPAAGKSAVGSLLGPLLGCDFVDADEVAGPFYAEVGWSVERLLGLSGESGYEAAHAAWEVALAHAVERLVDHHADAVIALGAGHTHVTSQLLFERVGAALRSVDGVVLLRPSPDLQTTIRVLRERCLTSKGRDWRVDGIDWLERWTTDGRDELLATTTIYNARDSAGETARRLAWVLQSRTNSG